MRAGLGLGAEEVCMGLGLEVEGVCMRQGGEEVCMRARARG